MIQNERIVSCDERFLSARGYRPENALFFDIETTGLSPASSHLYLIGAAMKITLPQGGFWVIRQYFAESREEEPLLLETFAKLCREHSCTVHFNGDRFDLPYLSHKFDEHGMENPLSQMQSFDLYRDIRPFKKLLGLEKLNQKAIERFIRIEREDRLSGKELISVYHSWQRSKDREQLRALFLHNYEDVLGMLYLLRLSAYPLIANLKAEDMKITISPGTPAEQPAAQTSAAGGVLAPHSLADSDAVPDPGNADNSAGTGNALSVLTASCPLSLPVPVPVGLHTEKLSLRCEGPLLSVRIPVYTGTLKHFFPDWKDYFYLPAEAKAIHKSLALFVDKTHREKATKENCFAPLTGRFLPDTDSAILGGKPFRESCESRTVYRQIQPWWTEPEGVREVLAPYVREMVREALASL